MTGVCFSDNDSCDENLTYEELASAYKNLCTRSEEVCRKNAELEITINQLKLEKSTTEEQRAIIDQLKMEEQKLQAKVTNLEDEVKLVTSNLEIMTKTVRMLGTGTKRLNEILSIRNHADDPTGEGYGKIYNNETLESNSVPPQNRSDFKMLPHPAPHQKPLNKRKSTSLKCHHCGKYGHIKSFCYKLYGYPKKTPQPRAYHRMARTKKEWKPKVKVAAHIAHTSFKASSKEDWYFDSGCSRHMTGEEKFLVDIKSYTSSYVIFGDGVKGQIMGVGKLINNGLPKLDNVLLVKGLKINLISISQQSDQGLKVDFSKNECLVANDKSELLMKGARSEDNCYLWIPLETTHSTTCLISQEDEERLWHQRLGHLKGIKKLVSKEAIRGLPKLTSEEGDICGGCQISKQIQKSHPMLHHQVTSKVHDVEPDVVTSDLQPEDSEIEEHYEKADPELEEGQTGKGPSTRVQKNHPKELIIGNPELPVMTMSREVIANACFISKIKTENVKEDLTDKFWINAIQEELNQFKRNEAWDLVPRPDGVNIIGTKWVYRNKSDENGVFTRNKARLVVQGYSQIEGVDFDETFAPVARLESIRLLLGVACILKFKLFQMDVKSAFLNGYLNEEVYVAQPKGFVDHNLPDHVYRLKKTLYGLKQAPRAWYERLTKFLLQQGYRKGETDKTLFVRQEEGKLMIAQIYVDDIVFGGMTDALVKQFVHQMQSEFEMSLVGELTYFLGLQVKKMEDTIFISQSKYAKNIVKKFGIESATHKRTPAVTHIKLTKDEKGVSVDQSLYRSIIGSLLYLTASRPDISFAVGVCARYQAEPRMSHLAQVKRILKYVNGTSDYGIMYSHGEDSRLTGYCDADWAGSADDRKSTSGGCFFLGNNLISCFSKKQNCVALSTAEAEYIAAGSNCSQLLWMKQMLSEYNVEQDVLTLYCDNMSAINISKNPIQHSRTKHIDIRHHFIRDLVEDKVVTLEHVATDNQLADIFTKALDASKFETLRGKLDICLIDDQ
ncbi:putative mitochondrial protein [Trifolium repens]|nr:putative mitochondrial protein [Trifolium repens]